MRMNCEGVHSATADGVPVLGRTYTHYDDGKISESRKESVTVVAVVPFSEASDDVIGAWRDELDMENRTGDDLMSRTTDYFVLAVNEENGREYVYARSCDRFGTHGWFSFGSELGDEGRLDVNGDLMELWWE